jgi:hypothetical protein
MRSHAHLSVRDEDVATVLDGVVPADGSFRFVGKNGRSLILEVIEEGWHIGVTREGLERLGLVVRDQRGFLYQLEYLWTGYRRLWENEVVNGYARFDIVTEHVIETTIYVKVRP